MDIDTVCQKLLLKIVLKEPHPIYFLHMRFYLCER